jgi:hypothetical protein
MRIALYGFLAVLAVVVLTQRPQAAEAVHTNALDGLTAQGGRVRVRLDGRRVSSLVVTAIVAQCPAGRHSVDWTPSVGQGNVGLRETLAGFTVHEWPDPRFPHWPGYRQNLWMHGRVSWDARRVEGTITYDETSARGSCTSGPIPFSVSR